MKRKIPVLIVGLMLFLGIGLILYPFISRWFSRNQQMETIEYMKKNVEQMEEQECEEEWEKAIAYNKALGGGYVGDPFASGGEAKAPEDYEQIMNLGDGVMAELMIPCIGVDLPVYHGMEESILERGVGHMARTALPIGGEGNHCVLAGHTGLPGTLLLTELDQVKEGDCFYIKVMEETLAYQVDQVLVVEPEDSSALKAEAGKDYVTLVTCTPYGINTHRLLVRGERIPYTPDAEKGGDYTLKSVVGLRNTSWWIIAAAAAGIVLAILLLLIVLLKKGKGGRK